MLEGIPNPHIDFQSNLDKFWLAYPLKTVKFKIFATPSAADGPPPKHFLHLVYVTRYHHVDFQPNQTMLGRPTSSPPKNPDSLPPLFRHKVQLYYDLKLMDVNC